MVDLFPWPPSLTARHPLPPTNNNQPRTTATTTKLSPIIPTLVLFFLLSDSINRFSSDFLPIMLVSLTVGKVDAGVAVLLTQDNRLVSFSPSPLSQQLVARPRHELLLHVFKRYFGYHMDT